MIFCVQPAKIWPLWRKITKRSGWTPVTWRREKREMNINLVLFARFAEPDLLLSLYQVSCLLFEK